MDLKGRKDKRREREERRKAAQPRWPHKSRGAPAGLGEEDQDLDQRARRSLGVSECGSLAPKIRVAPNCGLLLIDRDS